MVVSRKPKGSYGGTKVDKDEGVVVMDKAPEVGHLFFQGLHPLQKRVLFPFRGMDKKQRNLLVLSECSQGTPV